MSSETTKQQIKWIDKHLDRQREPQVPRGHMMEPHLLEHICQAKLALVQALEIQERMERKGVLCDCGVHRPGCSALQDWSAGGGE